MRPFFQLIAALALAVSTAGACGGGEKKADEPAPAQPAGNDSQDEPKQPTDTTDGGDEAPAGGDEFDSDPLPNPCKGGGN